jgi:hypothetical protein
MNTKGGPITPYQNGGAGGTLIDPNLPTSQASFIFWRKPVYTADDGSLWCPGCGGATYASNPYDFLYLAFAKPPSAIASLPPFTPGIAHVQFDKGRDMDKKKPAGTDGARVTFHGVDVVAIDIVLVIWTPEQLRVLSDIWPVLFPPAYKGNPPAYDVQHPLFAIHGIKSLQFVGGGGPHVDERGIGSFRMRAIEFLKPGKKNAVKTEVGAIGSLLDAGAYPTPSTNLQNLGPL